MNDAPFAPSPPSPLSPCAFRSFGRPQGSAPTLVLSHSLGADSSMWEPQFPAFSNEFHIVALDTRGHGASQVPTAPYSLPMLAADLLAVLDQLNVDRFHFCGLSMGGLIGQWLGCFAGERLRRLVLCNTAARVGSEASWSERIHRVREQGMAPLADQVVPNWFSPDFAAREPNRFTHLLSVFKETDPTGYIGCCSALKSADLRAHISTIRTPTLVVGGELDRSTPAAESQWLHDRLAYAELFLLPQAGHLSNLDRAELFTDRVLGFLCGR